MKNQFEDDFGGDFNNRLKINFGKNEMKQENNDKNRGIKEQSSSDFIKAGLNQHNKYRRMHGAPDLIHNADLTKLAQAYAEKLAKNDDFQHSNCKWGGKDVGENLAMCGGMPMTGENMTDMWYDEIKDYDFKKSTFSSETGHFTQVIWKNTKEVGFGLAKSRSGNYYAVGNYYPAGNFMGQFKTNVLPKNTTNSKYPVQNDDDDDQDQDQESRDEEIQKNVSNKYNGGKEQSSSDFIKAGLNQHNKYRRMHGAPDLIHNADLTKLAQAYAEKLAKNDDFQHSNCKWGGKDVGENLAMCGGMPMTGENMTDMWYDEIKDYDFKKSTFSSETGHFTQVIWKNTKEVGFGLAKSRSGNYYAVGNYYPAGNFMGQFKTNVLPKK